MRACFLWINQLCWNHKGGGEGEYQKSNDTQCLGKLWNANERKWLRRVSTSSLRGIWFRKKSEIQRKHTATKKWPNNSYWLSYSLINGNIKWDLSKISRVVKITWNEKIWRAKKISTQKIYKKGCKSYLNLSPSNRLTVGKDD